jgi:hypothetical protein
MRSGKVDPRAVQEHLSRLTLSPGKSLAESLADAGLLPKSEVAAYAATMAPGGATPARPAAAAPAVPSGDPSKRFGRYQILEEIARGGMGVVYRALEPALKRKVALKVMLAGEGATEEQIGRFKREARAVAGLQHPGIIQVFDVGQESGKHYFAMELVDGVSLDRRLKEEGRLSPNIALRIGLEAARALHFAHEKGIIHRDVKPANLMLAAADTSLVRSMDGAERPFRVLLGDFGLAKEMGSGSSLTMSGNLIGTPAYMSPEQAAGTTSKVDARSDVYSLGAVLYEALTGGPPFPDTTMADLLSNIRSTDPVSIRTKRPELHRDAELIVQKAMAKEPERRYQTAGEMADDIEAYLSGEAVSAVPLTIGYRVRRYVRRRRAAVISAAVSAAAVLSMGAWFGWRSIRDRQEARQREVTDQREREARAGRHVEEAKARTARLDFEGALVEAGLAEALIPGMPAAVEAAREARLARILHAADEMLDRESWDGARKILDAASEFRAHPQVAARERSWKGTSTVAVTSEEAGLDVDFAKAVQGMVWDADSFPALEGARAAGLCRRAGRTPLAATDLDFGDWYVVLSRADRAERVVPLRVERSTDVKVDYRVRRVGGADSTHPTVAHAVGASEAGAVVELAVGTHSFFGVPWKPGILVRGSAGARPIVSQDGTAIFGRCHGLEIRGIDFAGVPQPVLLERCFAVTFTSCRFIGADRIAVEFKNCDHWMLRDCEILDSHQSGLVASGKGGLAYRVTIKGAGNDGIAATGPDTRIERCVVEDVARSGISIEGDDCSIAECTLRRCREWGLQADNGARISIRDNLLVDNCTDIKSKIPGSIRVAHIGNGAVEHNTVIGGKSTGLVSHEATARHESNLVAYVEGRGFHYHGVGLHATDTRSTSFDYYLGWETSRGYGRFWEMEVHRLEDVAARPELNGSKGWRPLQHAWDVDPLFVDRAAGNFRLREDSPVRAAGPDGTSIGVRWALVDAPAIDIHAWTRREAGRKARELARAGIDVNDMKRAMTYLPMAELLLPGDEDVAALRARVR